MRMIRGSLFTVPFLVVIASFASAQEEEDEATVERVLKAKNGLDLQMPVAQLMEKTSREQLQEYKRHAHNTIALHAAWEEVKRSIRSKDPKFVEEDETTVIDRWALERFLGFVEGRLQVTPPEWWQKTVTRAETHLSTKDRLSLSNATTGLLSPYFHPDGSFPHLRTIGLKRREDGGLDVTSGDLSCTISGKVVEAIKKATPWRNDDMTGFTAWMDAERCVFGFHDRVSSPFKLHCLEPKSGKLLWSIDVWGYFSGGLSGSSFYHWAEMRVRGDTLYLFGIDKTGIIYIEGFSMKDGKNQFHFTTNYVNHFADS